MAEVLLDDLLILKFICIIFDKFACDAQVCLKLSSLTQTTNDSILSSKSTKLCQNVAQSILLTFTENLTHFLRGLPLYVRRNEELKWTHLSLFCFALKLKMASRSPAPGAVGFMAA